MAEEEEFDFEFQIQQEEAEKAKRESEKASSAGGESSATSNPGVYRDPTDGTEYEWDHVRKAWFPKINDDFIAQYQASYGYYDGGESEQKKDEEAKDSTEKIEAAKPIAEDDNKEEPNQQHRKRPAADAEPPQWFQVDDEHNTNVYVSNLPLDITEEEFVILMKKCGLVAKDDKNKLKVKLYRDDKGQLKGDARCSYIKVESVELALQILDNSDYRGNIIKVERAEFSLKGEYDPTRKPKKKKLNKREKEKQKKRVEKLFDWRPDKLSTERGKHEKAVVIKNFFDPKIFEKDPQLIMEYRSDIQEECEQKCGPVKRAVIYDLHPEGVVMVTFQEFDAADKCVELMNGRFFAGRKLDAQYWDGKTKYKIEETDEEIEKRMNRWYEHLEKEDEPQT